MNETEKLIELIGGTRYGIENRSTVGANFQRGFIEKIANHLLANGVRLETKQATSDKTSDKGKRLIYAEDLLGSLKRKVCIIGGSRNGKTMALFEAILRKLIEMTPTVDAAPVVHGKWEKREFGMARECSECGHCEIYVLPNFCPDCGAKMDGGASG